MANQKVYVEQTLQNAAASGNGTAIFCGAAEDIVILAKWSTGGSLGVLSVEEADDIAYAGTWSVITTITQVAASSTDALHLSGLFRALRARLATAVTGGTVTVLFFGSN